MAREGLCCRVAASQERVRRVSQKSVCIGCRAGASRCVPRVGECLSRSFKTVLQKVTLSYKINNIWQECLKHSQTNCDLNILKLYSDYLQRPSQNSCLPRACFERSVSTCRCPTRVAALQSVTENGVAYHAISLCPKHVPTMFFFQSSSERNGKSLTAKWSLTTAPAPHGNHGFLQHQVFTVLAINVFLRMMPAWQWHVPKISTTSS